jgi:hypothetical protein
VQYLTKVNSFFVQQLRGCLYVSIRSYIVPFVATMAYVCLKWPLCVLNGYGQNLVLSGMAPGLCRVYAASCSGVVRTFPGNVRVYPGEIRTKSEPRAQQTQLNPDKKTLKPLILFLNEGNVKTVGTDSSGRALCIKRLALTQHSTGVCRLF